HLKSLLKPQLSQRELLRTLYFNEKFSLKTWIYSCVNGGGDANYVSDRVFVAVMGVARYQIPKMENIPYER
ncbi:MAG: hypothetical protein K2L24_03085, partial [Opitutales bacterium]|nr:hypothetical protein [Opitutales bacterium]